MRLLDPFCKGCRSCSGSSRHIRNFSFILFVNYTCWRPVVAAYQWWPPFAHAITHLLQNRFGHFVKENKRNIYKNIDQIFCLGGKTQAIVPTYSHSNAIAVPIFQTHIIKYRNKHVHKILIEQCVTHCCINIFLSRKAITWNKSPNKGNEIIVIARQV